MTLPNNVFYRSLMVAIGVYAIGFIGSIALISEKFTLGIAGSEVWKHAMGYGYLYGLGLGAIGAALVFAKREISTPMMLTAMWLYGLYAMSPFCQSGSSDHKALGLNYVELATCGGYILSTGLLAVILSWGICLRGRS